MCLATVRLASATSAKRTSGYMLYTCCSCPRGSYLPLQRISATLILLCSLDFADLPHRFANVSQHRYEDSDVEDEEEEEEDEDEEGAEGEGEEEEEEEEGLSTPSIV